MVVVVVVFLSANGGRRCVVKPKLMVINNLGSLVGRMYILIVLRLMIKQNTEKLK